ncbi:MAG: sigma-70 family RNA polymerase sigma factor [Firmicutes bacterium]|nr:sigma-70 family RNA polymerase sigma factor [Bacillota bacterium]
MAETIEKAASLDERVVLAKQSKDESEQLIKEFEPFLRSRAARYAAQHGDLRREELFSTAMLAFYEAIQDYNVDKGHFFTFVNQVVSKRLIDHLRKLYRHDDKTISLEGDDDEQPSVQSAAIEDISARLYETENRQTQLVEEIEQFKSELSAWGITMEALSNQSPKHKALRDTYKMVVSKIINSPDIMQTIQLKRYFPVKAIANITGLPPKKLERARTFIIAALIIKMGDYDLLSDYVKDRG